MVVPEREERCLTAEDPKATITKPSVHAGQRESPVELRVVSGRVHGGRVCQARRSHGLANRLARRPQIDAPASNRITYTLVGLNPLAFV